MRAFVTGGGGFLGSAIVRELVAEGHTVVSYSRQRYPALEELGVTCVQGEISDAPAVRAAMHGSDSVFHVAAKAGVWGPAAEYERVNIEGTRAVLAAALENKVERLVFTSSPSVCFDGKSHEHASELPYSLRFLADYPRTKSHAERMVLGANGRSALATCALRPHLIFGPGDPHLVPRLIAKARAKRLARIGPGDNRVSVTYVENAAHAHVQACKQLTPTAAHAGRAYFIAQREPVALWPWIDDLLSALELPRVRFRIPLPLAYVLGVGCEAAWTVLRKSGEPPLTRFVALQLARTHTYDMGPAERDFGYVERTSLSQACELLIADLHAHRAART